MTCDEFKRHLSLHLDSELSPETASDLARHSEACGACLERLHAEEKIETKIRDALTAPQSGDAEAWSRAVSALPHRRRWPWAAAAAIVVAGAIAAWHFTRHRELDIAVEMAAHHEKVLAGKSPLEVESSDPATVNAFFRDKFPFPTDLRGPLPKGARLAGGRMCYLSGAPTAYFIVHQGDTAVTVAVFAPEGLDKFPMARERLAATPKLHCKVGSLDIVVHNAGRHVIAAIGGCPREALDAIAAAFE